MKYKYLAFVLSGIIIAIGVFNLVLGKGLNMGIDFAGGTLIRIGFMQERTINDVRQALSEAGLGNSRIQQIDGSDKEYMIRTMNIEGDAETQDLEAHEVMGNRVVEALRPERDHEAETSGLRDLNRIDEAELTLLLEENFPEDTVSYAKLILKKRVDNIIISDFEELRTIEGLDPEVVDILQEKTFLGSLVVLSKESVGPQVGKDLRRKTTQATVWALIGMLIYIGLRFQFAYGVSAIITLGHDVLVTVGILSLTQREINLPVIAAILTIVGYSLNDTIVIFDRVRENLKLLRKNTFSDILDRSINQTLSRTIITSGTTFLTVFALFVFGGSVINDFAFTMMVGVIVGTYSSIYQSCSILSIWKLIFKPKKGMGK